MAKDHVFKFDDGETVSMAIVGRVVKRTTEEGGDSYLVEYALGKNRTTAKWFKDTDLEAGAVIDGGNDVP